MDGSNNFDPNTSHEWIQQYLSGGAPNSHSALPTDAPSFMDLSQHPSHHTTPAQTGSYQYGHSDPYLPHMAYQQPSIPGPTQQSGFFPDPFAGEFAFPQYNPNLHHPYQTPVNTSSQEFRPPTGLQVQTNYMPLESHAHTPTSAVGGVTPQSNPYQERPALASSSKRRKRGAQYDSPPSTSPPVKRNKHSLVWSSDQAESIALVRSNSQRFNPLSSLCEAQLDEVASDLREKANALSVFGKRSSSEIMQRIFLKVVEKAPQHHSQAPSRIPLPSVASAELETPGEDIAEAPVRNDDYLRFQNMINLRRQSLCHSRGTHGALPCLREGCPGSWDDKGAWVRHVAQLIPDKLWICHFCKEIVDRKQRLKSHLASRHKEAPDAEKQACTTQEPYKVPFHGRCGFCPFESDNWTFFWLTHVADHLTGKNGPPCAKEQWEQPYPLPYEPDNANARPRRLPEFFDKFAGQGGDDDFDDDDDDDDGFGPGHGGSSRSPDASRSQSGSQRGLDKNKTQAQYTSSYTGNSYSPHTQEQPILGKFPTAERPRIVEDDAGSLKEINSCKYLQISENSGSPEDDDEEVCRPKLLSTLSSIRYGIDDQYPPYSHVRTVFRGTNTVVDQVKHRHSGHLVVRKRVRRQNATGMSLQDLFAREVGIMKTLSHPHVMSLIDHFLGGTSYSLFLAPVGDLTLKQFLDTPPKDCEKSLIKWHHCLSSAVSYLHSEDVGICHMDIKPSNIMITGSSIFLGDFGIARRDNMSSKTLGSAQTAREMQTISMTPLYAAPELIEQGLWGRKADIWALGCVFMEMATIVCCISIQKFHAFLFLVRRQTRELARHDSWEIGRMFWTWVLKWRSRISSRKNHDKFLDRSGKVGASMLQRSPRKRPSIRTISKTFIALTCCTSDKLSQQVTMTSTTDEFCHSQLCRLSFQSPKCAYTFQAATVRHQESNKRPEGITRRHSEKSAGKVCLDTLSRLGDWTTLKSPNSQPGKGHRTPSDDSFRQESGEEKHRPETRITLARGPRKSGSWQISRKDMQALSMRGSSFCVFSGNFHLKRKAEDFKSSEVKWSGWSTLCHNVAWQENLGDAAVLQSVIEQQQRRDFIAVDPCDNTV